MHTAAETVKIILEAIIGTLKLKSGDEVVVLINNLGGTSQLEQWLVTGEVHKQFSKHIDTFAMFVKCGNSFIRQRILQEFCRGSRVHSTRSPAFFFCFLPPAACHASTVRQAKYLLVCGATYFS